MNDHRVARRALFGVGLWVVVAALLVGGMPSTGVGTVGHARAPPGAGVAVAPSAPPALTISSFTVGPDPVSQGSTFSVNLVAGGGAPPYNYNWGPMPPNCSAGNAPGWQCVVSQPGEYSIGVTVRDSGVNQTNAQRSINVTSSGGSGGSGSGNGGNSNGNGSNGLNLSSFGPFVLYALIAGLIGFALLVALTVGVIMIAVILARRLPRPPRGKLVCGSCEATVPPGAKFCPACAAPLTPPKQG